MTIKKSRTIITGDIHGCIDEFNELITTLSYDKNTDRLILLGDLIDRGPDSVAVVKQSREMNLECVMGNHEFKFIKWYRSQGSRSDVYDRQDFYNKLSDDDVQYIMNMPLYIELEDVVAVHAGLKPGIALSAQSKDDLMHIRYTDEYRKFISLKKINKLGKDQSGAKFWTEFGPFVKSVVYGHNVHSYEDIRIDNYDDGSMCYGLDTGVCFGGKLTALIWETKQIVQVNARQIYYKSDFLIR